jgi:hypothetical protein
MESNWMTYQKEAAQFFTNLGFSTSIEESVPGARGTHQVDASGNGV